MKHYIINGKFMAEPMQGIVRYSREIINELDRLIDDQLDIELIIPPNTTNIPNLKKIRIKTIGKHTGIIWEQLDLGNYVRSHKNYTLVNLCNVVPLFVKPGITVVHDIMYKVNPEHYVKFRNKVSRYWHVFQYRYLFNHEKKIITVSEFSKGEIENYYPGARGKIQIIPNGWQHVLKYKESEDWQNRYPFLEPGDFYFSLATLSKNKNGIWIMKVAERNPKSTFAMGGKIYELEDYKIPKNVHLLGFVSDEDACALMKNCKAFLFPSVYEGFGIPPVEALAQGAEVIASNTTSLPEVLGNSVHYINPTDADVDLEWILKQPVEDRKKVLDKYGWDKSAEQLYKLLLNTR